MLLIFVCRGIGVSNGNLLTGITERSGSGLDGCKTTGTAANGSCRLSLSMTFWICLARSSLFVACISPGIFSGVATCGTKGGADLVSKGCCAVAVPGELDASGDGAVATSMLECDEQLATVKAIEPLTPTNTSLRMISFFIV